MKRYRHWYLLLLLIAMVEVGYAQTSTRQEVTVLLKNGKIIKGMTTLSMFEGYLSLEQDALTQTHIPYTDIQQIVFGPVAGLEKVRVKKPRKSTSFVIKERGYFHVIDLGFLVQSGGYYEENGVSITTIHGYTFNPHVKLGLGIGLDHYGYGNITAVPLFLSVQGLVNRKRWSPFYFLNAGGSAAWTDNNGFDRTDSHTSGGLMLHPGLGYRYTIGSTGLSFSLGYKTQKARLSYAFNDWNGGTVEVDERRTLRRLSMSVSVHF